MATAATKRKHKKTATPAVEYPKRGEKVSHPEYTIRVYAPAAAQKVGISIDGGPWASCRPAVGYWWYDWAGFSDGGHSVVVSMRRLDGERVVSEPHEVLVELARGLIAR